MVRSPPPASIIVAALCLFVWYVVWAQGHRERPMNGLAYTNRFEAGQHEVPAVAPHVQTGEKIMPKLGNETLKAELGRASWKLFHTMMARFPDEPTQDESDALKSYVYLFARLYPCGECAEHFQNILKKYPPQTSSRSTAAAWACFVHNQVNESKGKPIFDCNNIGDWYDCGCGDEEKDAISKAGANASSLARNEPVEIEQEGPTRGG